MFGIPDTIYLIGVIAVPTIFWVIMGIFNDDIDSESDWVVPVGFFTILAGLIWPAILIAILAIAVLIGPFFLGRAIRWAYFKVKN